MCARLSHSFLKNNPLRLMISLTLLVVLATFSFTTANSSAPSQAAPTATPIGGGRGQIAFTSNRDGNAEIYIMNADGSNVRRLTNSPLADYSPAWSPDGSQIAFTSNRDGAAEIYVMNADGTNLRTLTPNLDDATYPDWSPDGEQIIFTYLRDDNPDRDQVIRVRDQDIYIINVDGTNLRNLTPDTAVNLSSSWSPDGTQIVFASYRDMSSGLFLMDVVGNNVRRLTEAGKLSHYASPVWSPDGTQIAFTGVQDEHAQLFVDIYLMNADGSNIRRLTNDVETESQLGARTSGWSSDGLQIVFQSGRTGDNEIYVMNADGSNQRNITNNPADDRSPSWHP